MTLSNQPIRYRYLGNGTTDIFAFPSRLFDEEDIVAQLVDRATNEVIETLTLTTDYTVTIAENGTASIQVESGKIPANDEDILLFRQSPLIQPLALPTGTVFPARDVETELDRAVAILQEHDDRLNRAATLGETAEEGVSIVLPNIVAGRALKWNATEDGLINSDNDPDTVVADAAAAAATATTQAGIATTQAGIATSAANSILNNTGFIAVAADLTGPDTIGIVAADLDGDDNIGLVAGSIANVNNVGGSIDNVNDVAGALTPIGTVATNIADVNTAATNIADIIAAPGFAQDAEDAAALAESWAIDPIGDRPEGSAKYWAEQAAIVAGGGAVKITTNDTTPGVLNDKLIDGTGLTKTVNNPGGNETLTLAVNFSEVATAAQGALADTALQPGDSSIPIITPWVAYTPTFVGLGTVTITKFRSRRVGSNLDFDGVITTGTGATGTPATFTLGFNGVNGGIIVDNNAPAGLSYAGNVLRGVSTDSITYLLKSPGSSTINFSLLSVSRSSLTPVDGNTIAASVRVFSISGSVPIEGW